MHRVTQCNAMQETSSLILRAFIMRLHAAAQFVSRKRYSPMVAKGGLGPRV